VLAGVDGNLHFPVPSMNRLSQTEPSTFSILPFWTLFRDSVFLYFACVYDQYCSYKFQFNPIYHDFVYILCLMCYIVTWWKNKYVLTKLMFIACSPRHFYWVQQILNFKHLAYRRNTLSLLYTSECFFCCKKHSTCFSPIDLSSARCFVSFMWESYPAGVLNVVNSTRVPKII
jgi:hypothetical protein